MNRILFLSLFVAMCSLTLLADDPVAQINLQHRNKHGHYELPAPADEPDVYYDPNNQEIIIDGLGYVDYYDVEIAAAPSWTVVLTTQVSGSYDTIDVSSLPQGDYLITIESPLGNIYEGYFDTW